MKTTTVLKLLTVGLLSMAVFLFVAACSDSSEEDAAAGGEAAEHVDDSDTVAADDAHGSSHAGDDVQKVTVVMSDELRFTPERIEVNVGTPVHLALDNGGALALHDFTVDHVAVHDVESAGGSTDAAHMDDHGDMGSGDMAGMVDERAQDADAHESGHDDYLHLALDGGATGELVFTPMEPGEYEFYCSVPGHADAGMVGTLVVTEG